jgi:glycosyltransferase involved in cell wall biosynthesis
MLQELGRCRAMVLPSVWEDNCPLVILEAQARATAAIVSDRGGPPEFVRDGMDGFVVDPEDTKALAERIRRLADDAELAATFGDSGRRRLVTGHNAETHYESLLSVYGDAWARRRDGVERPPAQ